MRRHATRGLVGYRRRLGDGCGVVGFRCVGEEANIDCSVEGNSAGDRYQREQLQTQYTSRPRACTLVHIGPLLMVGVRTSPIRPRFPWKKKIVTTSRGSLGP